MCRKYFEQKKTCGGHGSQGLWMKRLILASSEEAIHHELRFRAQVCVQLANGLFTIVA